jgi:cytochrome c
MKNVMSGDPRALLVAALLLVLGGCSERDSGVESQAEAPAQQAPLEMTAPAEQPPVTAPQEAVEAAVASVQEQVAESAAVGKEEVKKDSAAVAGAVESAAKSAPAKVAAVVVSSAPPVDPAEMLALAKKSGCLACHSIENKIMGPAWRDVAAKYRGQANAKLGIIASISQGSSGKWGEMAMPANSPRVDDATIATLAGFILTLE